MDLVYIVVIVVVVAFIFVVASKGRRGPKREHLFNQKQALFTAAERSFLGVLDQAAEGQYRVFGKVRVADVLSTAKGLDKSTRASAFNKIKAKHFDFVLCDPSTLDIKAVVELNDKSHNSKRRVERDNFLRSACRDAGIPLKEIQAKRSYSVESIRQVLSEINIELGGETEGANGERIEPIF